MFNKKTVMAVTLSLMTAISTTGSAMPAYAEDVVSQSTGDQAAAEETSAVEPTIADSTDDTNSEAGTSASEEDLAQNADSDSTAANSAGAEDEKGKNNSESGTGKDAAQDGEGSASESGKGGTSDDEAPDKSGDSDNADERTDTADEDKDNDQDDPVAPGAIGIVSVEGATKALPASDAAKAAIRVTVKNRDKTKQYALTAKAYLKGDGADTPDTAIDIPEVTEDIHADAAADVKEDVNVKKDVKEDTKDHSETGSASDTETAEDNANTEVKDNSSKASDGSVGADKKSSSSDDGTFSATGQTSEEASPASEVLVGAGGIDAASDSDQASGADDADAGKAVSNDADDVDQGAGGQTEAPAPAADVFESYDLVVPFDTEDYQGNDILIKVTLTEKGTGSDTEIGTGEVEFKIPKIGKPSEFKDDKTGMAQASDKDTVTLSCETEYSNLIKGDEYITEDTLYYKDGTAVKDADGKTVTVVSPVFQASGSKETKTATFTFKVPKDFNGKDVVAGSVLNGKDGTVYAERSIEDNKTKIVHRADMSTNVTGTDKKSKEVLKDAPAESVSKTASLKKGNVSSGNETDATVTNGKVKLTDVVTYKNLTADTSYIMQGSLYTKDGKALKDKDGKDVVVQTVFKTAKEDDGAVDGTVDMQYSFDSEVIPDGATLVAYEKCFVAETNAAVAGKETAADADEVNTVSTKINIDKEVAACTDLSSAKQTVRVPGVSTEASDVKDGDKILAVEETGKVKDVVSYKNLTKGNSYTISGELHYRTFDADGNAVDEGLVKDQAGMVAKASKTFVAKADAGEEELDFNLNPLLYKGKDIVAYETITAKAQDDAAVGLHQDITDDDQTVYVADMSGVATDSDTGMKNISANNTVNITDTVNYKNLIPGEHYELSGELHYVTSRNGQYIDGGIVKDADGKEVKAKTKITAEAKNGEAKLGFEVKKPEDFDGKTFVVFATLSKGGETVFSMDDASDSTQMVYSVDSSMRAYDSANLTRQLAENSKVSIKDAISFTNLVPGAVYKVTGTLHYKNTDENGVVTDGGIVKDVNGREVTATTEFTADADSKAGTVSADTTLSFEFTKPNGFDGKTVSAFATLSYGDADIYMTGDVDKDDATLLKGAVSGKAVDKADGDKVISVKGTATIVDTISYSNLIPGKQYTAVVTLVNQSTKKKMTSGGEPVNATAEFTADKTSGTVDIEIPIDASHLDKDTKIVLFDAIKLAGTDNIIASHEDASDEDQTISLESADSQNNDINGIAGKGAQTGDTPVAPYAGAAAAAAIACVFLFRNKKKSGKFNK